MRVDNIWIGANEVNKDVKNWWRWMEENYRIKKMDADGRWVDVDLREHGWIG